MNRYGRFCGRTLQIVAFLNCSRLPSFTHKAPAQQHPATQNLPQIRTVRVNVGLVQTDVTVFDKQGNIVPDLPMNQFELRIDGKQQAISFFEMVSAGSLRDKEILEKAAGKGTPLTKTSVTNCVIPGRVFLFLWMTGICAPTVSCAHGGRWPIWSTPP